MNLKDKLDEKSKACFNMAEHYYYRVNEESYYHYNTSNIKDLHISDNYLGTQYGLVCEYYLKGILLPVLEITLPESNGELQEVVKNLSDEEKYKILIGDDNVINELSQKYKISKSIIRKLEGESLKVFGHDLKKMVEKVIEKANSKKFGEQSDKLKEYMTNHILKYLNDTKVNDAFVKGRYGHLDDYQSNVEKLREVAYFLRIAIKEIYNGISIRLYSAHKGIAGRYSEIDSKNIFLNIEKLIVCDQNFNISRVYNWKDGQLIPEYGIEDERKSEISFQGHSNHIFYDNDVQDFLPYYTDNVISISQNDIVVIRDINGSYTYFSGFFRKLLSKHDICFESTFNLYENDYYTRFENLFERAKLRTERKNVKEILHLSRKNGEKIYFIY